MNNVRELRTRANIKQTTLAHDMGVSQSSISDWEKKSNFPLDMAIALARYFHVSVGCIAGTEPIPDNYPNHWPPKPLQVGDPIPAYIGDKQLRYFPPDAPTPSEKDIFTDEQIKAINSMISAQIEAQIEALKEDTSSSSVQNKKQA